MRKENRKLGLEFIPIYIGRKEDRFDFPRVIIDAVKSSGEELLDKDILAVSSKFISMAKGMVINLSKVEVSKKAERLAEKLSMDQKVAELVIREADAILGGVPGFALALKNGVIAPNAGIDKSNVPAGYAILYSKDPFGDAEALRKTILQVLGRRVGIVVTDSRLMPLRMGTTGIAIAVAGFEPLKDERGHKDLFGNILRVTRRALADQIAAGVQLLMGEADESRPVVIVRAKNGAPWSLTDKRMNIESIAVPADQCIYMRGLPERNFSF